MLSEAAPLFGYGFCYMVLILLPHLFGWLGELPVGQTRASAITITEVGLTLSMPPLILAYGVAEHALRQFWQRASIVQAGTPGTDPDRFGAALIRFAAHQRTIYMTTLAVLTIVAHFILRAAFTNGWLSSWLYLPDPYQLLFVLDVSLMAYWLLGIGLFNCMFAVTLGRAPVALNSVVWAFLGTLIVGIGLCELNFAFAAVAFLVGALIFSLLSWGLSTEVLRTSDHCFASVI
jgi:hypothetical protein